MQASAFCRHHFRMIPFFIVRLPVVQIDCFPVRVVSCAQVSFPRLDDVLRYHNPCSPGQKVLPSRLNSSEKTSSHCSPVSIDVWVYADCGVSRSISWNGPISGICPVALERSAGKGDGTLCIVRQSYLMPPRLYAP